MEAELARHRSKLEAEYRNPDGKGFTYVDDDGVRIPLDVGMLSYWARSIVSLSAFPVHLVHSNLVLQYDGETTFKFPPNEGPFDPKSSRRLLFSTPSTTATLATSPSESNLAHLDNIVSNLIKLHPAASNQVPTLVAPSLLSSPAKNTPTKLHKFLVHAEESLGVANTTDYEFRLADKGYGPDILSHVDDKELTGCGLTPGDAIRLKRGASKWWESPEAKLARMDGVSGSSLKTSAELYPTRFEKRFDDGGSASVFGSHIVPGERWSGQDWEWWYFNQVTKRMEQVPPGYVPVLDPEFQGGDRDE